MATHGRIADTWATNYCTFSFDWEAEFNVEDNTAVIKGEVVFNISRALTNGIIDAYTNKSYVQIASKKYYFSTPKISKPSSVTLATITSDPIPLNNEQETSVYMKASFYNGGANIYPTSLTHWYTLPETLEISGTPRLDALQRKSTGSLGAGSLGKNVTVYVERQSTAFSHSITYACGSLSGTVCSKATDEEFTHVFPLDLAAANTTGTSVELALRIITYKGSEQIGSYTFVHSLSIPAAVAPSCTVAVSDGEGYADKYGGYVQGYSRFNIVVTPSLAYGSPIVEYKYLANGEEITTEEAQASTGVLLSSGYQNLTVKITDARGRSFTAHATPYILEYNKPNITAVYVNRCNADGSENAYGEYIKAAFDATITPLNNKNAARYGLSYQQTSGLEQNSVVLGEYNGDYSVSGGFYVFPADPLSSYSITVTAYDDFDNHYRKAGGATAITLTNWKSNGLGIAFGTVALRDNTFENAFIFCPSGGFDYPEIDAGVTLDDVLQDNVYKIGNTSDILNAPVSSCTAVLEVFTLNADGDKLQRLTACQQGKSPQGYVRQRIGGTWENWRYIFGVDGVELYTGDNAMSDAQTITLADSISNQRNGILLYFASSKGDIHEFYVSKYAVSHFSSNVFSFSLSAPDVSVIGKKCLYITDTTIKGHEENVEEKNINGFYYNSYEWTLRAVVGI